MKEGSYPPGPQHYGAIRIAHLDDDELEYYKHDESFQRFIKANRLAIYGNELWAWEEDQYVVKKYTI